MTARVTAYPVLIPVPEEAAYQYLVARNASDEGIYLVWHGAGSNTDLTEEVYEAITEEADAAGLAPTYHVYSRRNLIVTDDVVWYQIPDRILRDMADEIERTTGDPDRWLWEWRSSHPVDEGDYDGDDARRDEGWPV